MAATGDLMNEAQEEVDRAEMFDAIEVDAPATEQPAADKASPRYVILPDLPLDIYETPDADTHALIAECPSEAQAKLVLTALNQSAAVDALIAAAELLTGDNIKGTEIPAQRTLRIDQAIKLARAALAQVEELRKGDEQSRTRLRWRTLPITMRKVW